MVREDLVASAVNFLQDPSVSRSSHEKKISFLESKNLTKEEVDLALARAGEGSTALEQAPATQYPYQGPPPRHTGYGYQHGYNSYPNGPWGSTPPPPPQRDWRDWFIMATVTSSLGYGLYTAAKRYVVPLIAPPTTPQLEQDKSAVDEEFNKAFALIDQLALDTAALKAAEEERAEKVDKVLKEVNAVVEDLKVGNSKRESESKAVADQVQQLKNLVPTALEQWKANGDARLDDLSQELSGLRKLLENRVGKPGSTPTANGRGYGLPTSSSYGPRKSTVQSGSTIEDGLHSDTATGDQFNSSSAATDSYDSPEGGISKKSAPDGERKAAIPAWQMAAANRNSNKGSSETPSPG